MTSLRSGCGLQAELAHFASTAMMNLTVSSSGDPHRDSCATLGEVNPPRRDSASTKTGMIDANFMALVCCWLVFHRYRGASVHFALRERDNTRQGVGAKTRKLFLPAVSSD